MICPVNTGTVSTADRGLPGQEASVGGIDVELLDRSMRQAATCLFPKGRGLALLTLLFRSGEVQRLPIDGYGQVNVVVIRLPSIELFARAQQGWSKDTALRYITVLEALQILQRSCHAKYTELRVPLIPWFPCEKALTALDDLLVENVAREKLRQLACGVRSRFLLLYGSPRSWLSLFDDLLVTLTDVQDLLNTRLGATKRHLLQQRVENLKLRLVAEAHKGDFRVGAGGTCRSGHTEKGDFHVGQRATHGLLSPERGDFQDEAPMCSTQKGDFQGAAAGLSLNDNVIPLSHDSLLGDDGSDNDIVADIASQDRYTPKEAARVGRQLANFLENSPENTGGFVVKCKRCTRTVIRAAVIDVLVHLAFPTIDPGDERGRPRNKARWFHGACNTYAKTGTLIPARVEKWLKTDFSWKEIAQQLGEAEARYKRYMIANRSTADLVRAFLRGEVEQQALDEALRTMVLSSEHWLRESPLSLVSGIPAAHGLPCVASTTRSSAAAEKTWMDEYEAEALAEEILKEAGPLGVSKAVSKQEQGIFVTALLWRGIPMTMKTPQQWRTHFEKVQRSMALQQQIRERGKHNATSQ